MLNINKTLIKGSIILMIVFNLYSFINFIFQLVMARMLSVADYGVLAALFYFLILTTIFSESTQTIVAKYSSIENDNGRLKNFIKRIFAKMSKYLILLFIIYNVLIIFLSRTLEIPYSLMFINGLAIIISLVIPVPRGILQGKKRFYALGGSLIIESLIKLLLGICLVYIGLKLYGAISALILSLFIALIVTLIFIKDIFYSKEKFIRVDGIHDYSKPVFLIMFSLLAFYGADILIAQFVFDKETAGYYAIASILSKIIFWGTQPISKAMLPISSQESNKNNHEGSKNTYLNSLVMVLLCVIPALIAFAIFPGLVVRIFSGRYLAQSAEILVYLGIGTAILSLANLNVLYKISKGDVRNSFIFGIILIIGLIALFVFSDSIVEFSIVFALSSLLFLIASAFLRNGNVE